MQANTFGELFSITTFGESHGIALGVIIDGMPSKIPFTQENYQELTSHMLRRAPGQLVGTSTRKESDKVEILSGIFDNFTLGSPICAVCFNTNQRSSDYEGFEKIIRPHHGDFTYQAKYGIRDHRGSGRASGRETVARMIGGYFAKLLLPKNISIYCVSSFGPFKTNSLKIPKEINAYGIKNKDTQKVQNFLLDLQSKGETIGGEIEIVIENVPIGLGDPVFKKLKSTLGSALLSIGAIYSVEILQGIDAGISNGEKIILKVKVKAPATKGKLATSGRHDPCIIPRVIPVLESMCYLVLADHYLFYKSHESFK